VTTSLLDFLEQSLEKVDITQILSRSAPKDSEPPTPNDDLQLSSMSVTKDNQLSNFPVDIIVYCSVHPSTIRFRSVSRLLNMALCCYMTE